MFHTFWVIRILAKFIQLSAGEHISQMTFANVSWIRSLSHLFRRAAHWKPIRVVLYDLYCMCIVFVLYDFMATCGTEKPQFFNIRNKKVDIPCCVVLCGRMNNLNDEFIV